MAISVGDILNFEYSGAVQKISLPPGRYKLEVWGAQGGNNYSSTLYGSGGKGGYSVGEISLNKNIEQETELFVYVGGSGKTGTSTTQYDGGFNGGGKSVSYAGSGGGASDIRIGTDSLFARVIVAGGGGGAQGRSSTTYKASGGAGGGESGQQGGYYGTDVEYTSNNYGGPPGTQTAAGTAGSATYGNTAGEFGVGGDGGYRSTKYRGCGGGGGGWYGGGTGYYRYSGGGGGSGFVWTGANAPSGYLLGSEHYLTDAKTIAGNASMPSVSGSTENGNSGDGYARIICLELYEFAPDAPAGISAKSTQDAVTLSWSASAGATGYKVYRDGVLLGTVNGTSYIDSGLLPGTEHTYGVLAYDDGGESEQSVITVRTSAWAVTGLRQTEKGVQSIILSWYADSLATGWKIYKDGVLIASVMTNSYTESGLLPDEEHVYKVVAYNINTESEPASITARTEWAWYLQRPKIKTFTLTPSETTINAAVDVSVTVDEEFVIAENMHSGELFSGEV